MASSVGNNAFLIEQFNPLPQYAPTRQQASGRQSRQQTPDFNFVSEDPLYHIEGLTDQYYMRANALEGYAKMAYDKYGIDVTTPSFGNPHAMTLHKIFLKGLASTQQAGNQLRNAQTLYQKIATDPRYMPQAQQGQMFDPQKHAVNLTLDPIIEERNLLAKKDYTREEADAFNAQQEQLKQQYLQKAEQLEQQGDSGNAEYYRRQANAIQPATPSTEEEGRIAKQGADIALKGAQIDTQKSMQAENYAQARNADARTALAQKKLQELEDSGEINEVDGRLSFLQETVGFNGEPNEANLKAFFGSNVKDIRFVEEHNTTPDGLLIGKPGAKINEILLTTTDEIKKLFEDEYTDEKTGEKYDIRRVLTYDDDNNVALDISTPENKEAAMYVLNAVLNKIYGTKIRPEQLSQALSGGSQPTVAQTTQPSAPTQQPIDLGFK